MELWQHFLQSKVAYLRKREIQGLRELCQLNSFNKYNLFVLATWKSDNCQVVSAKNP